MEDWKDQPIRQQPEYNNPTALSNVLKKLEILPPLVDSAEVEELLGELQKVASHERFLLQAGDCVERFDESTVSAVSKKAQVLLDMAVALKRDVLIVGRIGGQYAKPRSQPTEIIEGKEVPIFRGEMINGFGREEREADPERLLEAYHHSLSTLTCLKRYPKFFTSHEGLLLNYEAALTRKIGGKYYNLSTHMPWIGHRTRHPYEAHVHYFSKIQNPIGIKVGPPLNLIELSQTIQRLNPKNLPGKITLITRLGAQNVKRLLPPLIEAMREQKFSLIWSCDPMHGNDIQQENRKVRQLGAILEELYETVTILRAFDLQLGGLHCEVAGEEVAECLDERALLGPFKSYCDPRLSYTQAIHLARFIPLVI